VHETTKVCKTLILLTEAQPFGNVASIDGYSCRVASGVPIAGIKGRDEGSSKRKIRAL
jgi:hypothetical protein